MAAKHPIAPLVAMTALKPPDGGTVAARPLTTREMLYTSGNRRRDNLAPKIRDQRSRSRLYVK